MYVYMFLGTRKEVTDLLGSFYSKWIFKYLSMDLFETQALSNKRGSIAENTNTGIPEVNHLTFPYLLLQTDEYFLYNLRDKTDIKTFEQRVIPYSSRFPEKNYYVVERYTITKASCFPPLYFKRSWF